MNIVHFVQLGPSQIRRLQRKSDEVAFYPSAEGGKYYLSRDSLTYLKKKHIAHRLLRSYSLKSLPIQVVYPARSFLFAPPDPEALHEALAHAMANRVGRHKMQLQYLGRRRDTNHGAFTLDRPGGQRSYQWKVPNFPEEIEDIRDQFPNIARHIKDPNTKVIISLGSGGVRLFAHASLMKFIDVLELRPYIQEIWGSSGGAIAGLPYSLGVPPETLEQEGYHLYNERYSFRFSPSKLEVLKNIALDTLMPNSENMLQGFLDCQNALRMLLEKYMKVKKDKIPFYCVSYNLKERQNEILTPEKVRSNHRSPPIIHADALDAVIASSSIPILYVPKKILRGDTEHPYVDGGTTEEVPLISPYRKWVQDRAQRKEKRKKLLILSVNLFPQVGTSPFFTHWVFKRVPALRVLHLSATYADLIRQARIDDHKSTLARDKNVRQWELTLPIKGTGVVNTKLIPEIIETAQSAFYDQLLKIEKSLGE